MKRKRVRYLMGAAGMAPAVLGVAFPTAAQASTGCTGHVEFYLPKMAPRNWNHDLVKGHGWYTDETNGKICIGTVVIDVYTSKAGYDYPEARMSNGSGYAYYDKHAQVYDGTAGTWATHSFGIHSSRNYLRVVGRSYYFPHYATICAWPNGGCWTSSGYTH